MAAAPGARSYLTDSGEWQDYDAETVEESGAATLPGEFSRIPAFGKGWGTPGTPPLGDAGNMVQDS